ncbi:hypothetical protein M951_chr3116 (nucleomorph) [Lotharella oceanica]|uniref:Uncharacterized protein n=1 Tax=Lotharella oceanica TaxID=641309 RepID=A0A060DHM2_9EUKA|nr:hypothetical protein M951_chr3116 [Lotharella oceanica]
MHKNIFAKFFVYVLKHKQKILKYVNCKFKSNNLSIISYTSNKLKIIILKEIFIIDLIKVLYYRIDNCRKKIFIKLSIFDINIK